MGELSLTRDRHPVRTRLRGPRARAAEAACVGAVLALALAAAPGAAAAQAWSPDAGPGRYRNPIIFADYSDPDVIRVGDDFYMTASSFNAVPALPILHSRDLVHWRIITHAIRDAFRIAPLDAHGR